MPNSGNYTVKTSIYPAVVSIDSEIHDLQLCGFSDASCRAFGAAIYARVVDNSEVITVKLLTAKSKEDPVRNTSLPPL